MSFSLGRLFRRFSTNAPSTLLITVVVISYAVFLFGGGLFTIINQPAAAYYDGSQYYFLYPGLSDQFVADSIVSVSLYALGFAGILAIYQSTKSAYKPREAYMLLVVGVTFLLLGYIFLETAIQIKTG